MNSNGKLNGIAPAEPVAEQPKLRNVMIAAPSYDGSVSAWHVSSLVETAKLGLTKGINIIPIYMSYDALVQRARNDIWSLLTVIRTGTQASCSSFWTMMSLL